MMKKQLFCAVLLLVPVCVAAIQPEKTSQQGVLPEHNAAFRKYLPHLYTALRERNSTGMQLLEYFDHLVKTNQPTTTWHLAQTPQQFIGDLLQMLDTLAADKQASRQSMCLLNGNVGTLPVLLLTAGLFRIGKQDVDLQLIGNQSSAALKNLNHSVRNNILTQHDRFHINQKATADSFINASQRYIRQPNTLFLFSEKDGDKITQHFAGAQRCVFNCVKRTVS